MDLEIPKRNIFEMKRRHIPLSGLVSFQYKSGTEGHELDKNKIWCVNRLRLVCILVGLNLMCCVLFCDVSSSTGFPGVPVDRLCQHSGICISAGNSHHCQCPVGYTGSYCEEQLNECSSNPCQHGATCSDFIGGYRCEVSRMSGQKSETSQKMVQLLWTLAYWT